MASNIEWHGDELLAKIEAAQKEAAHMSGEAVQEKWAETIPWSSGNLGSHINVTDVEDGAEVGVASPYAADQEFDESLRHPNPDDPKSLSGRKAHAGRDALNDSKDKIEQIFAQKIGAALK